MEAGTQWRICSPTRRHGDLFYIRSLFPRRLLSVNRARRRVSTQVAAVESDVTKPDHKAGPGPVIPLDGNFGLIMELPSLQPIGITGGVGLGEGLPLEVFIEHSETNMQA